MREVGKGHNGSPALTSLIKQGHSRSLFSLWSKWNILSGPCSITKRMLSSPTAPCKHNAILRETKGNIPSWSSVRSDPEKLSLSKISPNRPSGLEHTSDTNSLISFWLWERYFWSLGLQDPFNVIYKSKQKTWPTWVCLIFKAVPNVSGYP